MIEIVSLFCDGGVCGRNPSPIGGSWSWLAVDADNQEVCHGSGTVTPADVGLPTLSNNVTEFLAALEALEAMRDGWSGTLFTDSYVTLCRVSGGRKFNGIPNPLVERLAAVRHRLGAYNVVLLGGHPSKKELAAGKRKDGMPVSSWNVKCDERCGQLCRKLMEVAP